MKQTTVWLVAAIAALLAVYAYWTAAPTRDLGVRTVHILAAHQAPGNAKGAAPPRVSGKLASGEMITFALPKGVAYRGGARARVSALRQEWWPHYVRYRFVAYVDEGADEAR